MAGTEAISGVCAALQSYVEKAYSEKPYADATNQPPPRVYLKMPHELTGGLADKEGEGFTICLYRVSMQYSNRNCGNRTEGVTTYLPSLPVDLHLLMTPWAKDVSRQHQMLGWMMRAFEDMGRLPAEIVNERLPRKVFRDDESIELTYEPLAIADYFNLWDKLRDKFALSATYVVRTVLLDSEVSIEVGKPVRTREFVFGRGREPA